MTHTIPAWVLGLIRGIGFAAIMGIVTYLGNASNLSFLDPTTGAILASIALAIENSMAAKGPALFGAVKAKPSY
jgi:hypothetical protein